MLHPQLQRKRDLPPPEWILTLGTTQWESKKKDQVTSQVKSNYTKTEND